MSNVEEMVECCEKKVKGKGLWKIFFWSFTSNPRRVYTLIYEDFKNKYPEEIKCFIRICDNRLDVLKSLMSDLSIIFSAIFVSLAVIASFLKIPGTNYQALHEIILNFKDPVLSILMIFLFICTAFALICIGYIRTHLYVWASFKEGALILQSKSE